MQQKNAKSHQSRKQEINFAPIAIKKKIIKLGRNYCQVLANFFPTITHLKLFQTGTIIIIIIVVVVTVIIIVCFPLHNFELWDCLGLEQKLGMYILHKKI